MCSHMSISLWFFPPSSPTLFFHVVDPQAIFKLIPKEDQENLPADENTPEKRADKLWSYFDKKENGNIIDFISFKIIKYLYYYILSSYTHWYTVKLIWIHLHDGSWHHGDVKRLLLKDCPFLSLFLPERLAEGEFIQGILDNEGAIHLIQYEPKKWQ